MSALFKVVRQDGLAVHFCQAVVCHARIVRGPARKLVFEIFWAKNGYLDKEKLPCDCTRLGVIKDSPYRDLVSSSS